MFTPVPTRSMRLACAEYMSSVADTHPSLIAMGADGSSIFTKFASRYPERFIDVGIAEANLVSVAAGIAACNRTVMVGAIASFLLRRAYEQLRVDVCDANLPVKLIGVGGGLSYGALGPTHHMCEDIAILRAMPNIAVFIPSDASDAVGALRAALEWPGPAYIRIGAADDPVLHDDPHIYRPFGLDVIVPGRDLWIVSTGATTIHSVRAACALTDQNYSVGVINAHSLRPFPEAELLNVIRDTDKLLVVEEHVKAGGLASIVAEILVARREKWKFNNIGILAGHPPVGSRDELLHFYGLDAEGIISAALTMLRP